MDSESGDRQPAATVSRIRRGRAARSRLFARRQSTLLLSGRQGEEGSTAARTSTGWSATTADRRFLYVDSGRAGRQTIRLYPLAHGARRTVFADFRRPQ